MCVSSFYLEKQNFYYASHCYMDPKESELKNEQYKDKNIVVEALKVCAVLLQFTIIFIACLYDSGDLAKFTKNI